MSWTSTIEVLLRNSMKNPFVYIDSLLLFGWRLTFNPNENILFLPEKDGGLYDWSSVNISDLNYVFDILNRKIASLEDIGMVLHYDKSSVQLIIKEEYRVVYFSIYNAGRVLLSDDSYLTDFSWYLRKLVHPIIENDYEIKDVTCSEYP